jgi:hypothetical protein
MLVVPELSTEEIERFWSHSVTAKTGWNGTACIEWTGGKNDHGYGRYRLGRAHGKVTFQAHRLAYSIVHGPIGNGLEIDHLCRNRKCINPDHLEPVTPYVNMIRGESFASVNASKTRCPKRHMLIGNNLFVDAKGGRHCQKCRAFARAALTESFHKAPRQSRPPKEKLQAELSSTRKLV